MDRPNFEDKGLLEKQSLWPHGMNREQLEEAAKIYPILSHSEMRSLESAILELEKEYRLNELAELYTKYGLPTDEAPIVYYVSDDDPLLKTRINKVQ